MPEFKLPQPETDDAILAAAEEVRMKRKLSTQTELPTLQKSSLKSDTLSRQIDGNHYKKMRIQPWEIIEKDNLDFFHGSVLGYLLRWQDKDGIIDLDKAIHYIEHIKALALSGHYGEQFLPPPDVKQDINFKSPVQNWKDSGKMVQKDLDLASVRDIPKDKSCDLGQELKKMKAGWGDTMKNIHKTLDADLDIALAQEIESLPALYKDIFGPSKPPKKPKVKRSSKKRSKSKSK